MTNKQTTNVFNRLTKLEFEEIWSAKWANYSDYTRILIIVRSEEILNKEIKGFIDDQAYLKIEFLKETEDDSFGEKLIWLYLHSNSEFQYLHEPLESLSLVGGGCQVEAIDIDNRILSKYSYGDVDTGMYYDIDPEDFEPDLEENEDYYAIIDDRVAQSPIKIA